MDFLERFRELWLTDFEFRAPEGSLPEPVCMVAKEARTGRIIRSWEDELARMQSAPFDTGKKSALIAFYSSAEIGCFLSLGWDLPMNIIDLFAEFRCKTNGLSTPNGSSLLGAMAWYGLDSISAIEKDNNRDLILREGYSEEEKARIMKYCESDVLSLEKLFNAMRPSLSPQAVLRGRYMKSVAIMERQGIPVDTPLFLRLRSHWEEIKAALIHEVDKDFGVFDGQTFKRTKFEAWLKHQAIAWPSLASGQMALDDDSFKEMARIHPEIEPLRQLRWTLSKMRLSELAVGPDGRNRCLLSPFRAKTGRNQPSNSKFIFGPAVWLRGLIKPERGYALAYIDFEQQEFAIAGALSKDPAMIKAYQSGDPYIAFAKMANAVPANATKQTYPRERELFKSTCLAVQYCMGPNSLAGRLGITRVEACNLLEMHKRVFKKYWSWSDAAVDYATLNNKIHTAFGWEYHVVDKANDRTLRNFPMQANGAEMLRIACWLAIERGIKVCAPIHDALLIEAPEPEIEDAVRATQSAMREASEIVLSGFPVRSEANIVRYPDRYTDERGALMWKTITGLLEGEGELIDPGQIWTETPIRSDTPA